MTRKSRSDARPDRDEDVVNGRHRNGRIAAGHSGNLKGRPRKGSRQTSMTEDMLKVLRQKVTIRKNGKNKRVTELVAITERFGSDAMGGDLDAVRALTALIRAVQGLEQRAHRQGGGDARPSESQGEDDDAVICEVLAEYERRIRSSPKPDPASESEPEPESEADAA